MGYPNSAGALSESAVRARAGPGRFGALSAVQSGCVGSVLRLRILCVLWERGCASCRCACLAGRAVGSGCGPVRGRGDEPLLAGGERDAPMRAASARALPGRPCARALPGRCAANRAGPGRAGSGPGPIFTMRSRGVGGWDKTKLEQEEG